MEMITIVGALILGAVPCQERYPKEDDAWLRYKTGTWIENKITIEVGGKVVESLQKQTLKEKEGEDYVIEETGSSNGAELPAQQSKKSTGTGTGKETLVIDGKEYPCRIFTSRYGRAGDDSDLRYWMPKGNKYPLKVIFREKNSEGEATAVAVEEKVTVCGRDYGCARLQGKVKFGNMEGSMTVWLNEEIPGAQAKAEMTLNGSDGELKMRVVPKEVHIEK